MVPSQTLPKQPQAFFPFKGAINLETDRLELLGSGRAEDMGIASNLGLFLFSVTNADLMGLCTGGAQHTMGPSPLLIPPL